MFVIDFSAQLSVYRLSFPPDLFEEPAIFILDGQISRANITALMTFCLFNIDVLILPGHTTRALRPFNVGISSPLKSEFKQQLIKEINALRMEMTEGQRTRVAPAGVFDGIVRRMNGVRAERLTDFDSRQCLFAEQNGRIMAD
jgi:hypothetical protein